MGENSDLRGIETLLVIDCEECPVRIVHQLEDSRTAQLLYLFHVTRAHPTSVAARSLSESASQDLVRWIPNTVALTWDGDDAWIVSPHSLLSIPPSVQIEPIWTLFTHFSYS